MAKDYPRHQRVGDQIQRELAELIRKEIKDPRLSPIVTVAEVRVSPDLSHSKVYITVLDDKGEETVGVLNRANGFLRNLLAARLRLRTVPHLVFIYDTVSKRASDLSELIDKAVSSDRQKPSYGENGSE